MSATPPPSPTAQVEALLQEAARLRRHDLLPDAIDRADEALGVAQADGDAELIARAQLELADLYRYQPRTADAFTLLTAALATFRTLDHALLPRTLAVQGMVLGDMGDHTAALDLYREALRHVDAHPERAQASQAALCYGAIGIACTQLGDFEQAETAYLNALAVYEAEENWVTVCHLWNNIVILKTRALAEHAPPEAEAARLADQARAYLDRAEALNATQARNGLVTAVLCNSRADLSALTGDLDGGLRFAAQALSAYRDLSMPRGEVDALTNLGEIHLRRQEPQAALDFLGQAQALIERHDLRDHERRLTELQSTAFEAAGDYRRALAAHRRFHTLRFDLERRETHRKLQQLAVRAEIERAQAEARRVQAENAALDRLARQDALTGLANRRAFDEWAAALPGQLSPTFALAVLDIDHFKAVNDQHSHAVGDEVLRQVGRVLRGAVRDGDLVARFGGEEFVVVLKVDAPAEPLDLAARAEQLRAQVEAHDWARIHPDLRITVSIGVTLATATLNVAGLLDRADSGLYAAKRAGRNRVTLL